MSTPEFAASLPNAFVPAASATVPLLTTIAPLATTTAPVLHAVIFPSMDASDTAIASRTALSVADRFAVTVPDTGWVPPDPSTYKAPAALTWSGA